MEVHCNNDFQGIPEFRGPSGQSLGSSIVRSLRVGSDAIASLEPSKSAVVPSPERQNERRAVTLRAWNALVLDDLRALTRGVLEHALEVVESGFRDFSTLKEKIFLWSLEVTRGELTQKLVVDVAMGGSFRVLMGFHVLYSRILLNAARRT
jgi:hypothetical protein